MREEVQNKRKDSQGRERIPLQALFGTSGRDELNLAEFPFAILQYQQSEEVKTLSFSDSITGKDGQPVERRWTVTGSDAFGLPVAGDMDIVIGLLALM